MSNRRSFLKSAAAITLFPRLSSAIERLGTTGFFGLHPFIADHPEAVFIMKTDVADKMNSDAKRTTGHVFGESVFLPMAEGGVPTDISIPIKPNFKTAASGGEQSYIQSTATDPWFVEGMLESMKSLGIDASRFHLREAKRPETFKPYGFVDMAKRTGTDLRVDLDARVGSGLVEGRDYNWTEVPKGVVFWRIPHLEPINQPGTWMLNIAKFKTHPMGMTLCCKNLQGSVAQNYQQFCNTAVYKDSRSDAQQKTVEKNIDANYSRHVKEGLIPRWDRPETGGGHWMELWASRTLDNVSSIPCQLYIIEGIYGRDGNASGSGPHPLDKEHSYNWLGFSPTGRSKDFPSNIIIFGRDIFRTDIIGHWLGGHEPGNFGLFHLAMERGLSNALDPRKIPVYLWENGSATRVPLEALQRTPLLTMYLRKDFKGGKETFFHFVDEPFDYSKIDGIEITRAPEDPSIKIVHRNPLKQETPSLIVEFSTPEAGPVKLDAVDDTNSVIDVLVEKNMLEGAHAFAWQASSPLKGDITFRMRGNRFECNQQVRL